MQIKHYLRNNYFLEDVKQNVSSCVDVKVPNCYAYNLRGLLFKHVLCLQFQRSTLQACLMLTILKVYFSSMSYAFNFRGLLNSSMSLSRSRTPVRGAASPAPSRYCPFLLIFFFYFTIIKKTISLIVTWKNIFPPF